MTSVLSALTFGGPVLAGFDTDLEDWRKTRRTSLVRLVECRSFVFRMVGTSEVPRSKEK